MAAKLTHIDASGAANMVDVGDKDDTVREASAEGFVRMRPETFELIRSGNAKKGDVLGAARIAGIMAAKRTHDLIPLCHPLLLTKVTVDIDPLASLPGFRIVAGVKLTGKTGVEMEALTAVSVACLTIYDMAKAVDRAMEISGIRVLAKSGGKSGDYKAARMKPLITVAEALARVLAEAKPLPGELASLHDAAWRVLASDIVCPAHTAALLRCRHGRLCADRCGCASRRGIDGHRRIRSRTAICW